MNKNKKRINELIEKENYEKIATCFNLDVEIMNFYDNANFKKNSVYILVLDKSKWYQLNKKMKIKKYIKTIFKYNKQKINIKFFINV